MASVTVRTLRYYDKVGLLSPSSHSEAGYRLYSGADFFRLQQILALKFLGFALDEIRVCLQVAPAALRESLALQKAMVRERRAQLDTIISAIDETEKLLQANTNDWEAIIHVIQVMQMSQNRDWRQKYFTIEQLQQMEELSKRYYTIEQRQKLAEWGKDFTEEGQHVATRQWDAILAELKRFVSEGQDPACPVVQDFVGRWMALIEQFTHGDAGIAQSLKNMYEDVAKMPAEERPYPLPYNEEEERFLRKAIEAYQQGQGEK